MGNFYTNITLRGANREKVREVLTGRRAFLLERDGYTVVFDEACESQEPKVIKKLGARLSREIGCPALGVLNHDDSVLLLWLHQDGVLVNEYNSNPGYDRGRERLPAGVDAEALCRTFGSTEAVAVARALQGGTGDTAYFFAVDRHAALVEALKLPMEAVGMGYSYITAGELPDGVDAGDLWEPGKGT